MRLPPALVTDDTIEQEFRLAMAHAASPVSVVTVLDGGRPHGTTVSAFLSLSMDPPMLLVSLDRRSRLLSLLSLDTVIGVNVLADNQQELSHRFAQATDDKFAGVPWHEVDGAPAFVDRHAWVALRVANLTPAGDHVMVLGDVIAAEAGDREPLTYWRRTYGTHRAH